MVEMVEILDGRLGQRSVEQVRYVINNLLHLVIVKYGDISLLLCISTGLRLVTILSQLVKYLVILHADPRNKSYLLHTSPTHCTFFNDAYREISAHYYTPYITRYTLSMRIVLVTAF